MSPLPFVHAAFRVLVDTTAAPQVLLPTPRVLTPVLLDIETVSMSSIIAKSAFKTGTVRPAHHALPVSHATIPLTSINGAILIPIYIVFDWLLRIKRTQGLMALFITRQVSGEFDGVF